MEIITEFKFIKMEHFVGFSTGLLIFLIHKKFSDLKFSVCFGARKNVIATLPNFCRVRDFFLSTAIISKLLSALVFFFTDGT